MLILYLKTREIFNQMQGQHSGSRAYSVDCYCYICIYGFLRPSSKECGITVPRFLHTIKCPLGAGGQQKRSPLWKDENTFCQCCFL